MAQHGTNTQTNPNSLKRLPAWQVRIPSHGQRAGRVVGQDVAHNVERSLSEALAREHRPQAHALHDTPNGKACRMRVMVDRRVRKQRRRGKSTVLIWQSKKELQQAC